MIRPVDTVSLPVRFSGERRQMVEGMANSLFPAQDVFDRMDEAARKARPWYERVGADLLRIPAVSRQREVRQRTQSMSDALLKTLDNRHWPKRGGNNSLYWQAYQLPEKLFVTASGEASLKQRVDTVKRCHEFVVNAYVPLLERTTEGDQETLAFLLDAFSAADSGEQSALDIENLSALAKNNPAGWDLLLKIAESYRQILANVYYGHVAPLPPEEAEGAYKSVSVDFVQAVIRPGLKGLLAASGEPHAITGRAMGTIMPALLAGVRERKIKLYQLSADLKTAQADILEGIRRLLVLDGDLRGEDLDAEASALLHDTIVQLRKEAEPEPVTYEGPDLPVTHCNLPATVPK